ncbi:indole-3-glycerol phosphate synthase TrpC [Helicobacter sp. 23-1044]
MDILAKIIKSTKARVEREKAQIPFNEMRQKAESLYKNQCESRESSIKPPFAFENALDSANSAESAMHFICEVKKASPSKGIIAQDFPYLQIARDYESAGADCISCLTEPEYFLGADSYLREIAKAVKIPVLRKDFIIDSYMIYGAKVLGADCVLLISEALELSQMVEFCDIAKSLGLSVLIESHSESALQNALQTSAKLIGVNNRDLRSFKVDLGTSIRLKRLVPKDRIFVSESGIATREDIAILQSHDINAALIGESLMRKSNKIHALANLKGANL